MGRTPQQHPLSPTLQRSPRAAPQPPGQHRPDCPARLHGGLHGDLHGRQRGGTVLGFILGLVVGLGAALGVAVYVTKVPVPFLNKGASRSTTQDAAEIQKNKNWDPNSPLYGNNPARPSTPVVGGAIGNSASNGNGNGASPVPDAAPAAPATAAAVPAMAPAVPPAPLPAKAAALPDTRPGADPLSDLAQAREKARDKAAAALPDSGADPFNYFVQAGAFRTQQDADAQRAKLAMMGWEARVSEREQNGRTVYRVRVGPFGKRDDAQQIKEKLDGAAVDSALVRAPR